MDREIRVIKIKFDDGVVFYHRMNTFKLLDEMWETVVDYYSTYMLESELEAYNV